MTDKSCVRSEKSLSLGDIGLKNSEISRNCKSQLDENGEPISIADQLAVVTHYLQLRETQYAQPFDNKAQQLINTWLSKPTENNNDQACEFDASQLYAVHLIYRCDSHNHVYCPRRAQPRRDLARNGSRNGRIYDHGNDHRADPAIC